MKQSQIESLAYKHKINASAALPGNPPGAQDKTTLCGGTSHDFSAKTRRNLPCICTWSPPDYANLALSQPAVNFSITYFSLYACKSHRQSIAGQLRAPSMVLCPSTTSRILRDNPKSTNCAMHARSFHNFTARRLPLANTH